MAKHVLGDVPSTIIFGIGFFFSFKDSDSKNEMQQMTDPLHSTGLVPPRVILLLSSFTLSYSRGLDCLVIPFFFVGLALIVAFYFVERKVEYPLIPVILLTNDIFIIMVSSCILGMSMVGLTQFLPYMLLSSESSVIKEKKRSTSVLS